jgi:SEC-C motif-containing protein
MINCPCNPDQQYVDCCGPYLSGAVLPPTAEALMRSRYSAYVLGKFDYLLDTWHPDQRDASVDFGVKDGIRWQGLEILAVEKGAPNDQDGTVEFKVLYHGGGLRRILHEKSYFQQQDGKWFYVNGDIMSSPPVRSLHKVGRNEPCFCGSGRKYKKCCWEKDR